MNPQQRTLTAVSNIAAQLAADYPRWITATADTQPDALAATRPHNGGHGSGHSDPTAATALTWADQHQLDIDEAITALLAQTRWIANQIHHTITATQPRPASDDADRRRALCTADPCCANYAVRSGWCWTCIKRQQRNTPPRVDKSTPPVIETGALGARAQTTGTCGRCGHTVHGISISDTRDLLAAHHTSVCRG